MKIWATSDLHIDYRQNLLWFEQLSEQDFTEDFLIIAGDISDEIEAIQQLFATLLPKFKKIFFVPGNHDLWIHQQEAPSSFEKFHRLLSCTKSMGIETSPYISTDVQIIPLYSWYDFSFGQPSATIKRAWKDFRKCLWEDKSLQEVAAFFHQCNLPLTTAGDIPTISFSHFLPFTSMFPPDIPAFVRALFPVFGSKQLMQQIDHIRPDMHLYGHSHLNRSFQKDGICYLNNAFGYPKEAHICRKKLLCVFEDGKVVKNIPQWPKNRRP